jgi:hypothetical protein
MSIRGGRDFMTVNPGRLLCDSRYLLRRRRINDADSSVALIDNQQGLSTGRDHSKPKTKKKTGQQ